MHHVFGYIGPETIAIFIPIIAVLGGVLIAITAIIVGGRKKDQEHQERLRAMEKGIPLPDPPEKEVKKTYSGRRAGGLVLSGIGLALWIAISTAEGTEEGVWGLIPLFIGVGLLIAAFFDKREYDREQAEKKLQGTTAPAPRAAAPTPPTDTDNFV
jgi:cadmium resistance protein CadD (predicted permease)